MNAVSMYSPLPWKPVLWKGVDEGMKLSDIAAQKRHIKQIISFFPIHIINGLLCYVVEPICDRGGSPV
jgi:hypothetical protein